MPEGHPRLEPLILPLAGEGSHPRPGASSQAPAAIWPDEHSVPRHVLGPGLFTIPHGPVRSGVMESIEYLVETPGEDIPHLNMRLFYKHRGIEKRFEQLAAATACCSPSGPKAWRQSLTLAYCHAAEQIGRVHEVPWRAALIRVLHAELERLAAHLDVAIRLADAAGLAVATARFGLHKERVARLVGRMCGSRFGRGVVVPGGVSGMPMVTGSEFLGEGLERAVTADTRVLMGTASFLDRLRGAGPLRPERALEHGALGPIGKASGYSDDAAGQAVRRLSRARAGDPPDIRRRRAGPAGLRWDEVRQSFHLLRQAADELAEPRTARSRVPCERGPDALPAGPRLRRARCLRSAGRGRPLRALRPRRRPSTTWSCSTRSSRATS